MPQANKTLEDKTPAEKRFLTDLKAAQGSFALAGVVSLIYLVKLLLGRNFNFFFSLFLPELVLKSAAFTKDFLPTFDAQYSAWFASNLRGQIPTAVAVLALAVLYGGFALVMLRGLKNQKTLYTALAIYALDTICLLVCRGLQIPEIWNANSWIDVIYHLLILVLLIHGARSLYRSTHGKMQVKASN